MHDLVTTRRTTFEFFSSLYSTGTKATLLKVTSTSNDIDIISCHGLLLRVECEVLGIGRFCRCIELVMIKPERGMTLTDLSVEMSADSSVGAVNYNLNSAF
jgi:hypothetical protein